MKQLSILMSIMILTLSFYKSSAQKLQYDKKFYHTIAPYEVFLQEEDLLIVKNYDIDSVLISEDFIKNKKYIKSLWHIRDGKKYLNYFQLKRYNYLKQVKNLNISYMKITFKNLK